MKDEYCEVLTERSGFYRLLSSLYFKEVSEEFLDRLAAISELGLEESSDLAEGFKDLARYLSRKGPDPRTDLAVDYAKIFLSAGTFEGEAANPYESIYTSEEGLIMQDARDEVRLIYIGQGVNVEESLNLPEDHLSFELEFLAIMSDKAEQCIRASEDQALQENLMTQKAFIEDHLLNWLPILESRIVNCANHSFYPAIMKITQAYLKEDLVLLGEMIAAA